MHKIYALLEDLGDTSAEVTANLRSLGINGKPGVAAKCPLAMYLRARGCAGANVGLTTAWAVETDQLSELIVMPDACIEFRRAFDIGDIIL